MTVLFFISHAQSNTIMPTRQSIRNTIKTQRENLAVDKIKSSRELILDFFINSSLCNYAHIAFYLADNNECDPELIYQYCLDNNKSCYLPVLHPNQPKKLLFLRSNQQTKLIKNKYHILEPEFDPNTIFLVWKLDVVFVPLVAFEKSGHRLGRGGGYYDKTFSFKQTHKNQKPLLIGLGYDFQEMDSFKTQDWDIQLDGILTESGLRIINQDAFNQ